MDEHRSCMVRTETARISQGFASASPTQTTTGGTKMKARLYAAVTALILIAASAASVPAQEWEHAVSLFNQKQYRPAIREFHAVLKANPDAWQSWYYIGASHFGLQSYDDAIDAFQNYVKSAEKDDKAQTAGNYFIGMSYYQTKQYDKAISALARYVSLSDKTQQKVDTTARAALGRCYIFT